MREEAVGRGTWDVRVIGPLQVSRAGRLLPLGSRQQRAVLAVLVCNTGHVVSRGSLVDALWGPEPPPGATASIHTHVSHLRQILEPDRAPGAAPTVIVTHAAGYRLTIPETAIDVSRFQGLVSEGVTLLDERRPAAALAAFDAALSLWRGDVLGDLTGYAFVVPVAAGLNEIHAAALEGRIQALMDLGRDAAALGELDRLLAEHPLREGLHAQRMLALYRAGRQSEALEAYRQLRSRLDEQLGLDPSPAVRDLQGRILRHDPGLTNPAPISSAAQQEPAEQDAAAGATAQPVTSPRAAVPPGPQPTTVPAEVPAPPPGLGAGRPRAARRASVSRSRRMLVTLLACAALTITLVSADATVGHPRLVEGNTIGILDSSGDVVGAVPAGTSPVGPAYGGGAIWVASESDGTVTRIDPATGTITQRFEVGHNPSAITATDQDVWVANAGDGTVTRINIAANRITPPAIQVGTQPAALSVGGGGVWVANSGDNTVQRIEERTGHPGPAVDVGDGPDGVLVDGTSVWVANGRDGTVSHLDATTGVEISSPVQVGAGARGLARVGDELWVTEELSQSVSRINLALNQVHPIYVGDGPTSLAVLDGALWVSEKYANRITRIDPSTERQKSVPVGGSPQGAVEAQGRLWVAVAATLSATHRGGTLTIAAADLPGGTGEVDPARVYEIVTGWPERLIYQGLVALRYSGQDSHALVPNLATRLPQPSDGGRTYTFHIRPGVLYSTGAEVRASDFVRGVIRAVTTGPTSLYSGIVGAPTCREHPSGCEQSIGAEADDATGRLTLHLARPDPDFLYKLTLFVYPTPPDSLVDAPQPITPGTGPYLIAAYEQGRTFELARNPYFTQPWSVAAAPAGYPDVIRWLKVADVDAAVAAVDSGRAELAEMTPLFDRSQTRALVDDLTIHRPRRVHTGAAVMTTFVVLNSSIPPFNSIKARQAVNYAVDRRTLVDLSGGPAAADPACQLPLPGFPGYVPYCPYTTSAPTGPYAGPDLTTARRLIEESGTAGARVTVTDLLDDINPAYDAYIAQVLSDLGYQVNRRQLEKNATNLAYFYDPNSGIQVQSGGWLPDYPRPSTFYDELVRCPGFQQYLFGYCDQQTDLAADAALALQATDPGRALRAWASVQRTVTDNAPMVFGVATRDVWYSSDRVGNYQQAGIYGPLFSQLWVR